MGKLFLQKTLTLTRESATAVKTFCHSNRISNRFFRQRKAMQSKSQRKYATKTVVGHPDVSQNAQPQIHSRLDNPS